MFLSPDQLKQVNRSLAFESTDSIKINKITQRIGFYCTLRWLMSDRHRSMQGSDQNGATLMMRLVPVHHCVSGVSVFGWKG